MATSMEDWLAVFVTDPEPSCKRRFILSTVPMLRSVADISVCQGDDLGLGRPIAMDGQARSGNSPGVRCNPGFCWTADCERYLQSRTSSLNNSAQ
jgi:hypothetical protein